MKQGTNEISAPLNWLLKALFFHYLCLVKMVGQIAEEDLDLKHRNIKVQYLPIFPKKLRRLTPLVPPPSLQNTTNIDNEDNKSA